MRWCLHLGQAVSERFHNVTDRLRECPKKHPIPYIMHYLPGQKSNTHRELGTIRDAGRKWQRIIIRKNTSPGPVIRKVAEMQ